MGGGGDLIKQEPAPSQIGESVRLFGRVVYEVILIHILSALLLLDLQDFFLIGVVRKDDRTTLFLLIEFILVHLLYQ